MSENNSREISISSEALLKIVGLGLILFFLWMVKDVLILILIAVTIASGLEPLVAELHRKKIPRAVSVLVVYLLAIALLVFIGYLVVPAVVTEIKQLAENSGAFSQALQAKLSQAGIPPQSSIGQAITGSFQSAASQLTNISSGNFLQTTLGLFNSVLDIISILVISFYLIAEQNSMKTAVLSLIPTHHQQKTIDIVDKIQRKIGWWLIGQFILSAVIFTVTLIGLTLLHVPYALVLAILAGFCELVPYIGPFIAAIPAIFFAFVQSPALAVLVAIFYLLVQKTEGYILVPKIMQKTVGVPPLVILVAILIGLKLAGIFGVFLAVPIVAGITVYINEYRS